MNHSTHTHTRTRTDRPSKLILSLELQEYAPAPTESPDREAQIKRLSHVLEARFAVYAVL